MAGIPGFIVQEIPGNKSNHLLMEKIEGSISCILPSAVQISACDTMRERFENCLLNGRIVPVMPDWDDILLELSEADRDLAASQRADIHHDCKWAIITAYSSMFHSYRALIMVKGYQEKSDSCLRGALDAPMLRKDLWIQHSSPASGEDGIVQVLKAMEDLNITVGEVSRRAEQVSTTATLANDFSK